ncbi:hypothetical protein WMF39_05070 [Sorangium sp. So ce1504]|uniref:hypothetical protein n=1 Tax=Sorangium sp. So ce1504 TaxID=3133337 RepID=UPI003F62ECFD
MDDDELLRALTRIAQRDPTTDPRWRRLAEETRPEDAQDAPGDAANTAARSIAEREEREVRPPLDDETRARLADQLLAQLREPRGGAPAPSPQARPAVDRKSGIRFRCPEEWDCDAEEASDVADAAPLGADADSLSGTSAPSTTDAPVCRAIDGESVPPGTSEPPRDARSSAAPGQPAQRAQDGADALARPPRKGLPHPELVVERRSARRTTPAARARAAVGVVGWVVSAALVSLLALRPAPFAPGAAPLPDYTLATTILGDGPQQGDRGPGTPRHVGRGKRLTIALSPGTRVPAPVAVRAFLVQGGSARPWSVELALDGVGGASISGTREELFRDVVVGPCEVVLVVGHPDALPGPDDPLPDEDAIHLAGGRLLRQRLFLD